MRKIKSKLLIFSNCHRFLNEYLKSLQRSENTILSYDDDLTIFMLFLDSKGYNVDTFTFSQLNEDLMLEFRIWIMEERGCSPQTANHRFGAVREYIRYCGKFDAAVASFWLVLEEIPPLKREASIPEEVLTEEHVALLLKQPIPIGKGLRDRTFLIVSYETAARVSEVRLLKMSQLSNLNGKEPKITYLGKGNKYRKLPISKNVADHIKLYIKEFFPDGYSPDDYVFYTVIHGEKKPLSRDCIEKFLHKYADMARKIDPSFPENIHTHLLRSSRATHLCCKNKSAAVVSKFMGHENIDTTMKYYVKPNDKQMRDVIEDSTSEYDFSVELKDKFSIMKRKLIKGT